MSATVYAKFNELSRWLQRKKNRNLGHMKTNDGKHISNVLIRNCHRQQTTVQCKRVTWKRPKKYAEEVGAHILCNVTAAVWHLDNVYVCATPHPNERARTGKKCLDHVSDTKWTYYNMPKRNRNWHLRKRMWETESDTVQRARGKATERKRRTCCNAHTWTFIWFICTRAASSLKFTVCTVYNVM